MYMQKISECGDNDSFVVRKGDWICINCSNFNFSFRDICNRCKIQSKHHNYYTFVINSPVEIVQMSEKKKIEEENTFQSQLLGCQDKQNKPFQSAILLTPTKNTKYQNENQGEPYKSPQCLPSVSPLLKKYNYSQYGKYSATTGFSASSSLHFSSPEVSQFNLQDTKRVSEFQIDSQIEKLLSQIDI